MGFYEFEWTENRKREEEEEATTTKKRRCVQRLYGVRNGGTYEWTPAAKKSVYTCGATRKR